MKPGLGNADSVRAAHQRVGVVELTPDTPLSDTGRSWRPRTCVIRRIARRAADTIAPDRGHLDTLAERLVLSGKRVSCRRPATPPCGSWRPRRPAGRPQWRAQGRRGPVFGGHQGQLQHVLAGRIGAHWHGSYCCAGCPYIRGDQPRPPRLRRASSTPSRSSACGWRRWAARRRSSFEQDGAGSGPDAISEGGRMEQRIAPLSSGGGNWSAALCCGRRVGACEAFTPDSARANLMVWSDAPRRPRPSLVSRGPGRPPGNRSFLMPHAAPQQ